MDCCVQSSYLLNDFISVEDSSNFFDALVDTDDSSNFFDTLTSSRNVLYPPQDMQLHFFNQMDSYQQETTFAQSTGSAAQFDYQNVLEMDNSSDEFSSPSQSNASDVLALAVSVIGGLDYFSCEDSIPSGSSCCSQMDVSPVPPVAVAEAPMPSEPVAVQSNQELFQVLIERGREVQSPAFKFSTGLNKLFANRNSKCPVQFKTAIPAQFEGQFWIHVYVSFTELAHQWAPVLCCQNDAHLSHDPDQLQLMQCDLEGAVYQKKEIHGVLHNSILLPLNGKNGLLCANTNFKFVCYSTHASIDRKPLQLNFTLVDVGGNSVAEKIIGLKISARPGRDIEAAEKENGISRT